MDPVGVGLILFSIILFSITFYFCTKPPQTTELSNKTYSVANTAPDENSHNTIIVKLPGKENYADRYDIDLKLCLVKHKKDNQDEQEWKIIDRRKPFHRNLDEYL